MTGDVPPARRCTLCEREAVDPTRHGALCERHLAALDGGSSDPTEPRDGKLEQSANGGWDDVDFTATEPNTYPPTLLEREQWMGRLAGEKRPFAPWGDKDQPEADPDKDARYKWGLSENYVDGETVARGEVDPRLDGRLFIQQETDPFAFLDGDNVRCPDTGAVHPRFIEILDAIGLTYADISTSESGIHANYVGDLPNDQGQATFEIDTEPWGSNDAPPTVEIYANTHICVTTGEHVLGTPADVRPWDADAVEAVLDEYDTLKDAEPVDHDTDRDLDLADHTPDATDRDETTTDARDVALAVDRLRPNDLPLRTRQVGTDATGWEQWDPSTYRTSSGNDSLHRPADEPVFYDHKHGESFGVLSLFAAEQGILSKPWDRLAGKDWWDAVDAAREAGAPIPEYQGEKASDTEHRAILPPVTAWDWREAGKRAAGYESGDDTELTVDDVRERTVDEIADAISRGDDALIEVLPTGGKSYGAIAAAARSDTPPVTILTTRGRKEQYDQLAEWCDEHGLTYKIAPSFFEECETAAGHHGDGWQERVSDWYRRGATGQDIHKYAEDVLGRPLPCQCDERSGEHIECRHTSAWRFDPAENPDTGDPYDVVIGHYIHAKNPKVTHGRAVISDEFTDGAYEHALGHGIKGAISYFLKSRDDVPYDDYTDLIENRDDDQRRADALLALSEAGLERDGRSVLENDAANASAPLAAFTLLAAAKNDLGNGWERAAFPNTDSRVGLHNRETDEVRILAPPELDGTRAVVALDGTPTPELWNLTLGRRLDHRPVLDDDERPAYIRDALGLSIVRTTEYLKPYNSTDHVNVERDVELLKKITDSHGEAPGVISTRTALREYENADALAFDRESGDVLEGPAETVRWHGNVLGSNQFKHKRVGAVIGSNHYGDEFIKKWAAYAGETADRNDEKGAALSYGTFGDKVLTHMREHDTLQAAMRFGRDGKGATVYVHTDTLPDWVPLAGEGRVIRTRNDGERQVLDAVDGRRYWTTREIADHPDVQVTERRVRQILDDLVDRGYVTKGQSTDDGRAIEWADDGLEELPDHVELPKLESGVDTGSFGNGRSNTIYTWVSATSSGSPLTSSADSGHSAVATDGGRETRGVDPPR